MSRIRRRGLRREPPDGWPLDDLLVGVATLRTIRELFKEDHLSDHSLPPRAWDLALWSGVTPKGCANSLERLRRLGLAHAIRGRRRGEAPGFRLDWSHPLVNPLARLFAAEWRMVRPRPLRSGWRTFKPDVAGGPPSEPGRRRS
ncbi:MAG: hypothetical protein ACE5HP_13000 [Gemmatimonadota bacterium]